MAANPQMHDSSSATPTKNIRMQQMKLLTLPFVAIILCACAGTPPKVWSTAQGAKATPEQIQSAKLECQYEQKFEQAKSATVAGIGVARYEPRANGTPPKNKFLDSAELLRNEAMQCMMDKGLISNEKPGAYTGRQ